jgi:hypothetical protein
VARNVAIGAALAAVLTLAAQEPPAPAVFDFIVVEHAEKEPTAN